MVVIKVHAEAVNSRMNTLQERTIVDDPEIGDQYERYKAKVPYRIIPYIW